MSTSDITQHYTIEIYQKLIEHTAQPIEAVQTTEIKAYNHTPNQSWYSCYK